MFTGKRPTDDIFKEGLSLHNFVKTALPGEVIEVIDPNLVQTQFNEDATSNHGHNFWNGRNNKLVAESLISIFEIGISCSAESPQQRMNIGDVSAQLSSIRNKLLRTRLPREREVGSATPL
uniref:LRR-RLK n=1 Tax=Vernicia montana TaxID=316732 RepID=A0A140G4Z5_9ROSI|nr:LRR-RLK [Vernicia montana]